MVCKQMRDNRLHCFAGQTCTPVIGMQNETHLWQAPRPGFANHLARKFQNEFITFIAIASQHSCQQVMGLAYRDKGRARPIAHGAHVAEHRMQLRRVGSFDTSKGHAPGLQLVPDHGGGISVRGHGTCLMAQASGG